MKHPLQITMLLVYLFLIAQLVGLSLVFLDADISIVDGEPHIEFGDTAIGARPNATPGQIFIILALGIGIGTAILLLLIKYKMFNLWKIWFFTAVTLSLFIAFAVVMPELAALLLAILLGFWKVFKPNALVHNFTELFIYAGIVILIGPLFNLTWAIILLVAISIYDMYAVWKSKHMVTLAEASTKNNLLAGLYIPTKKTKLFSPPPPPKKRQMAVLGGGDIAFPLLFSSVVFTWLVNTRSFIPISALLYTGIISITCTIVLSLLFTYSQKGKLYPAMPFLTAGCFIGLGIISLF